MRVLDAWMASGGPVARGAIAAAPAFAPLRVGTLELANRVVCAGPGGAAGAGLVLSGPVAVTAAGRRSPEAPTIDDWKRPEGDTPVALLLGHAGPRGARRERSRGADLPLADGWELLSASAFGYGPFGARPRALDGDDFATVTEQFAAAAERAEADMLILDCAHGGLLASFISPLTNRRKDRHGGPLEHRLRFPLEVFAAVREAWGERPLGVRLSITDWARGGTTVAGGIAAARAFAEAGCDLVHVVAGQTVAESRPDYRAGFLTTLSARVRTEAHVATLVGGHLTTLDAINTIVAAGRGDLCILDLPVSALDDLAATRVGPEAVRVA